MGHFFIMCSQTLSSQEGHTAHATLAEANEMVRAATLMRAQRAPKRLLY
jgi:hypothetical protein